MNQETFLKSFSRPLSVSIDTCPWHRLWEGKSFNRITLFPSAPLAQLDRATDYESVGWKFESSGAHHSSGQFESRRRGRQR